MRSLQATVAWFILILLVAWPPMHILLAHQYHFSTWRYGGLGMYATPPSGDRDVYVFIQDCQAGNARQLDLFSFSSEETHVLSSLLDDVRSLSREADFDRLGHWVDAQRDSASSLGILVTEPHIDTKANAAYAEAFGFIRERGRWSPIARRRGPAALGEIMARLEVCP
jgi:hypothetical protein